MQDNETIHVHASARLHLGFLDLHGGLGRQFGSLGVGLSRPFLRLSARRCHKIIVSGEDSKRAKDCVQRLLDAWSVAPGVRLHIEQSIPQHAGLGSGTQLALAIGSALCRLYKPSVTLGDLAKTLHRGRRSGIGLACFEQGGFILDGGIGSDTVRPPVITRLPFPAPWHFLLIFDTELQGLSGEKEHHAFRTLHGMSAECSGQLCRQVLMQMIPALLEGNLQTFGAALNHVQRTVGESFTPYQQGAWRSPHMEEVFSLLQVLGACGMGQSSWGPSCFALLPDEAQGVRILQMLREHFQDRPNLRFTLTTACNHAAKIRRTLTSETSSTAVGMERCPANYKEK